MDATGGFIKFRNDQLRNMTEPFKRILTYFLYLKHLDYVGSSSGGKSLGAIQIAEYASSRHDAGIQTCTISEIKFAYEKYFGDQFKFRHIISDMCWASIHSQCLGINNENVKEYSDHIYRIADGSQEIDTNKSYIHICKSHKSHAVSIGCQIILKNFFRKDEDSFKNVYFLFMLSFSLLQNSCNLKEFVEYFPDICTVFGSKFECLESKESLQRLRQAISIRPQDDLDFEVIYVKTDKVISDSLNDNIDLNLDSEPVEIRNIRETIKSASKFYKICIEKRDQIFNKIKKIDETPINSLCCDDLIEFLLEKHVPYAAFWSGFSYAGINLNVNNPRLERKIRERKEEVGLGQCSNMYVNRSLNLIKGTYFIKISMS